MTRQMNALSLIVLIATLTLFVFVDSTDFLVLFVGFMIIFLLTAVRVRIRTDAPGYQLIPLLFEVVPLEDTSSWKRTLAEVSKGSALSFSVEGSYPEESMVGIASHGRLFARIAPRQEKEIEAYVLSQSIDSLRIAHIPDSSDQSPESMTVIVSIRTQVR